MGACGSTSAPPVALNQPGEPEDSPPGKQSRSRGNSNDTQSTDLYALRLKQASSFGETRSPSQLRVLTSPGQLRAAGFVAGNERGGRNEDVAGVRVERIAAPCPQRPDLESSMGLWRGESSLEVSGRRSPEWRSPGAASHATTSSFETEYSLNSSRNSACGEDYDGERNRAGERHGHGVERFDHGDKYDGQWRLGAREGSGTFWWADGAVYEGEWRAGERDGTGTMRWPECGGCVELGTPPGARYHAHPAC